MQIHKIMKEAITTHKKKVELTQWAIIAGITSLVYSEYIRRIQNKTLPIPCYMVPEIEAVKELLKSDGAMMERLSADLIDTMVKHPIFCNYIVAPELILFREEKIEIMKTIFDLYITPNLQRRVPESIAMKFGLNNGPEQQIRQDRTIELFDRRPFSDAQFQFVSDQCCLQLLMLMPTIKKNIDVPEDNMKIEMAEDEILTIGNENAICPIHFDSRTIDLVGLRAPTDDGKTTGVPVAIDGADIMELLQFVTSTTFTPCNNSNVASQKPVGLSQEMKTVRYLIKTNTFNQIGLTHLEGIDQAKAEEVEGQ